MKIGSQGAAVQVAGPGFILDCQVGGVHAHTRTHTLTLTHIAHTHRGANKTGQDLC